MRTVKDSIRNGVDLTNSYKLNSLINDLGFNLSTLQKYMTEPDQVFSVSGRYGHYSSNLQSSPEFEQRVREMLKKNRIMKESAMDGGIKLLFILEDFLDKNREQFNDLETSNLTMKRRLEELESQSNNFLGLVNKVEQENLSLKREHDRNSRFSPLNNS